MNLLLLDAAEVGHDHVARLAGRRAEHLCRVLEVEAGRRVRLGIVDGGVGSGRVLAITAAGEVELAVEISQPPPPPSGIDLIVALPRPAALHRILQCAAAMGVGRLDLVNAWRVEKSFFSSPVLRPETLRRHLLLGAEQGRTTRLPKIRIQRLLVPFLRRLGERPDPPCRLLAHPAAEKPIEDSSAGRPPLQVAVGPEGGWIDREVETFGEAGFEPVRLGPWILRVETAVAAVLAQIELLRRQRAAT